MDGFGIRLRELRLKKLESQRELAEALGISEAAVSMYESETRVPRDEIKVKFADHFGLTIDEIFFGRELHRE